MKFNCILGFFLFSFLKISFVRMSEGQSNEKVFLLLCASDLFLKWIFLSKRFKFLMYQIIAFCGAPAISVISKHFLP